MPNGSAPWGNFLQHMFEFLYLLIRGLIKGLGLSSAIFDTSSIELHYNIMHSDRKLQEEFFESIAYILKPTN